MSDALYVAREPIFPRRVSGRFRTLKWILMIITLGIYYIVPWIRWDRGPNLPDQAVLIDLANRRFYFFWIEIWPQEFYFVAGLLIMAGLGLFLFTSALGRVWCGYACPQTVWTDLYILVERWIEGDRNARIRLHKAPWSFNKARLRLTKWLVWLLIGLGTGGAWVFYFADAPTLLVNLVTFNAPAIAYSTIGILTATTFIFGGFMREQVCIYMCPWPRIQGAMMDDDTLTVAYRAWRGEPRAKGKRRRQEKNQELSEQIAAEQLEKGGAGRAAYKATPFPGRRVSASPQGEIIQPDGGPGDCIDCMACVNVCPMGIDIRDGQQLECITCALCIDACDEIMAKIGKPRGLIDYIALADEAKERQGGKARSIWQHFLRIRTLVYTFLWASFGVAMVFALFIRTDVGLNVSPVRNPMFITLSDGTVRNVYDVRISNKGGKVRIFRLGVTGDNTLKVELEGYPDAPLVGVDADTTYSGRLYIEAAPGTEAADAKVTSIRIWAYDEVGTSRASRESTFNGRGQ